MLFVIADQIPHAETVVGSHKIDARIRPLSIVLVQIAGTGDPGGEFRHRSAIASPELTHTIPIFPVPFGPQNRKVPYLITAFPQIPRFCDQLHLRKNRVLMDNIEKRAQLVDLMQFPRERTAQVEAKTVHVHLVYPVTQRIHNQLQHVWRLHVERVPAPGVIHVKTAVVVHHAVVGTVVDPSQTDRRP